MPLSSVSRRTQSSVLRSEEKAFGFWIYLMTDAIIFALLFATYVVMSRGTADGLTGRELFSLPRTFGETLVLLFSTATFGFATLAARASDAKATLLLLFMTFILGASFVSMEVHEFRSMMAMGA